MDTYNVKEFGDHSSHAPEEMRSSDTFQLMRQPFNFDKCPLLLGHIQFDPARVHFMHSGHQHRRRNPRTKSCQLIQIIL